LSFRRCVEFALRTKKENKFLTVDPSARPSMKNASFRVFFFFCLFVKV